MKKQIKIILGILIVFILGAVVGGLATRMVYEANIESIVSGDWKAREDARVNRFSKHLDLDAQQRTQVRTIIQEARKELLDIDKLVGPQKADSRAKTSARIRSILNPQQAAKYDRLIAEPQGR